MKEATHDIKCFKTYKYLIKTYFIIFIGMCIGAFGSEVFLLLRHFNVIYLIFKLNPNRFNDFNLAEW